VISPAGSSVEADRRAIAVVRRLNACGFDAFLVGGCVRDQLLGAAPKDWDVATSAAPEAVMRCFSGLRVIETGVKHGTVTVVCDNLPVEVTTFRADGIYEDCRRPAEVTFVRDLREDLARRDFTVNALAWHPDKGLIDCFGGADDLAAGVVRCVGSPDDRLQEDALRILRALRFSATLGFEIDKALANSIHGNRNLLSRISSERISAELMKMLPGKDILHVLLGYPDVFSVFIPEIAATVGFDQKHPSHPYDLWEHTARSIDAARADPLIRLALLLHDLGKPQAFFVEGDGIGHFYRHETYGAEIARRRLNALAFAGNTVRAVTELVLWHDVQIPDRRILKWLNRLGEERLRQLFAVQKGDALAHGDPYRTKRLRRIQALEQELEAVLEAKSCFTLKGLAIDGTDILALGAETGPAVGEILSTLLDGVMEGRLENEREALIAAARGMVNSVDKT